MYNHVEVMTHVCVKSYDDTHVHVCFIKKLMSEPKYFTLVMNSAKNKLRMPQLCHEYNK